MLFVIVILNCSSSLIEDWRGMCQSVDGTGSGKMVVRWLHGGVNDFYDALAPNCLTWQKELKVIRWIPTTDIPVACTPLWPHSGSSRRHILFLQIVHVYVLSFTLHGFPLFYCSLFTTSHHYVIHWCVNKSIVFWGFYHLHKWTSVFGTLECSIFIKFISVCCILYESIGQYLPQIHITVLYLVWFY